MNFIYLKSSFITWMVYLDPTHWPAPSWLVSSVGRALHRYRRGHGFKSRTRLNFFQVLSSTTRFSSVLSCEDLFISSKQNPFLPKKVKSSCNFVYSVQFWSSYQIEIKHIRAEYAKEAFFYFLMRIEGKCLLYFHRHFSASPILFRYF